MPEEPRKSASRRLPVWKVGRIGLRGSLDFTCLDSWLPALRARSLRIHSDINISKRGSQMPESVLVSASKRPLTIQSSQSLGPFVQIGLLTTAASPSEIRQRARRGPNRERQSASYEGNLPTRGTRYRSSHLCFTIEVISQSRTGVNLKRVCFPRRSSQAMPLADSRTAGTPASREATGKMVYRQAKPASRAGSQRARQEFGSRETRADGTVLYTFTEIPGSATGFDGGS